MRCVVLFDIDGTVLTFDGPSPGPGRVALTRAMKELHACEDATEGVRLAGGTDRGLARRMLARAGLAQDDGAIARVIGAYLVHLADVLRTRHYRPIGEVVPTVAALRARGATVGLATGNVREGAQLKLASAGVAGAFDLAYGGFGSDAEMRADIVRMAAARCHCADGAALVVVGDTEHDVHAARAVGARVVGVATDQRARAELEAAGADAIVSGCGADLVAAVLASTAPRVPR